MNLINSFALFLHRKRITHFLLTGVTGVFLNMLITWALTTFVFGVLQYYIGYIIGTIINICYNFFLHSLLTFKTHTQHSRRFTFFVLFSFLSTTIQISIVYALTEFFGRAYYLPIIACTILLLSIVSFLFFKHSLFYEGQVEVLPIKEELREAYKYLCRIFSGFYKFMSVDKHVIFIILLLAILTRIPFLSYPDRTLYDEVIYADYAIQIINQVPFFDIHPPLARMIFATAIKDTSETLVMIPLKTDEQFNNFPYEILRTLVAVFGIVLPLLIYGIGRLIGYRPIIALFPALFIIFDNALVLYSRTILPDTLMLVADFAGILFILIALKATTTWGKLGSIFFAGVFLGLAISVKWTALGILGLALLWLLAKRLWKYIAIVLSTACIVYIAVFYLYFSLFTKDTKSQPLLAAYNVPWIEEISYPSANDPVAVFKFLPAFHQQMLYSNNDPAIISQIMTAPRPLTWPMARTTIQFWIGSESGKSITLTGNTILWIAAFFVLLFELGWVMYSLFLYRRWPIDQTETILLLGFMGNYLPFFFIERPMFLYHYFPALIILFLLTPKVTPRIIDCMSTLSKDRYIGYAIVVTLCVLALINYFLLSPTTYGF